LKLGEFIAHGHYVKAAAIILILRAALERDPTNPPHHQGSRGNSQAAQGVGKAILFPEERRPGCDYAAHQGHRYPHRRPLPVVALHWCNFSLQVQLSAIRCSAVRTQVLLTSLIEPP
jgi:hypothetical protein